MTKIADEIRELERQPLRDPIRTAYMRGYSRAELDITQAMQARPQDYIEYIQRGCTPSPVPSYGEAIAALRQRVLAKDKLRLFAGEAVTDKLRAEASVLALNELEEQRRRAADSEAWSRLAELSRQARRDNDTLMISMMAACS